MVKISFASGTRPSMTSCGTALACSRTAPRMLLSTLVNVKRRVVPSFGMVKV